MSVWIFFTVFTGTWSLIDIYRERYRYIEKDRDIDIWIYVRCIFIHIFLLKGGERERVRGVGVFTSKWGFLSCCLKRKINVLNFSDFCQNCSSV